MMQLRYRFERVPTAARSELEQFARAAQALVQTSPWLVPHLPFATTAQVSGGLLEATLPVTAKREEEVRLKAIESSGGTLLENSYDQAGRLRATAYPDGVRVHYQWNAAGQLSNVDGAPNCGVCYHYGKYGLVDRLTYPGDAQFRYEYGAGGKLFKCEYPDQRSVWRKYDRQGRVTGASLGQSGFGYEWDADGSLARVTFHQRGEICGFAAHTQQVNALVTSDRTANAAARTVWSALGAWSYAEVGRPYEMSLPDGDRLCLRCGNSRASQHVWNSQGQTTHEYDKDGVLSATIQPNGMRAVYHRVPESRNVYLVSASGLALFQYDQRGRLCKIRADNGQYQVFGYDRRGQVQKIATAQGTMRVHHDGAGRLERLGFSNGLSADITYGTTGFPSVIALRKAGPNALASALKFAGALWQWATMKSTLRLEDQVLREE